MKILKYISAAVLVLCVYSLYAMKGTYTAEWGAAQARKARQATSAAQLQEIYQAFERSGKAGMASKYAKDVKTLWDTKLEQEAGRRPKGGPKGGTSGPTQDEIDAFFAAIDEYTQDWAERAKYKGFFNALPDQSDDINKYEITKRSVLDEKGNIVRQISMLRRAQKTPAADLTPEEIAALMKKDLKQADQDQFQAKFDGFSQAQKDAFAKEYNDNKGSPAEKMNAAKDYMNKQPGVAPQGGVMPTEAEVQAGRDLAGLPQITTSADKIAAQDPIVDAAVAECANLKTATAIYQAMEQLVKNQLIPTRKALADAGKAGKKAAAQAALKLECKTSLELFTYAASALEAQDAMTAQGNIVTLLQNNFPGFTADLNGKPIVIDNALDAARAWIFQVAVPTYEQ